MISFENICHSYGPSPSVTDISFQIEEGQVVTLLGPSGCGKTTLLRLAAGFEHPLSGQITQDKGVLSSPSSLIALKTGKWGWYSVSALFPHMTIGQNMRFGLNELTWTRQGLLICWRWIWSRWRINFRMSCLADSSNVCSGARACPVTAPDPS